MLTPPDSSQGGPGGVVSLLRTRSPTTSNGFSHERDGPSVAFLGLLA